MFPKTCQVKPRSLGQCHRYPFPLNKAQPPVESDSVYAKSIRHQKMFPIVKKVLVRKRKDVVILS